MAGETIMKGDLRLKLGDKTIFHATDCQLQMSRELRERQTKDTSGIEVSKSTKSWNASFNGLATFGGDGVGTLDFYALHDIYDDDADTLVQVEFAQDASESATRIMQGEGIITELSLNGTVDEDGTVSLTVTGSGPISQNAVA